MNLGYVAAILLLFARGCSAAFQSFRPFYVMIESPTPAQWAYAFNGSSAILLNHPSKLFIGGWYVANYSDEKNPFVLMMNGTTINTEATWRLFVDKKLFACGKGPSGLVDGKHGFPVLASLIIPDTFIAKEESLCSATIGQYPASVKVEPFNHDRTCGHCQTNFDITIPAKSPKKFHPVWQATSALPGLHPTTTIPGLALFTPAPGLDPIKSSSYSAAPGLALNTRAPGLGPTSPASSPGLSPAMTPSATAPSKAPSSAVPVF